MSHKSRIKNTLLALSATVLALPISASAGTLTNLDCVSSNGVTLTTSERTVDGVLVTTTWGLFRKTFQARIGLFGHGSDSYVTLEDTNAKPAYLISLPVDPNEAEPQVVSGSLLRQSLFPGGAPTFIAGIRCSLQLSR